LPTFGKIPLCVVFAGSDRAVSCDPSSTIRTYGYSVPERTETRMTSPGSSSTPNADAAGSNSWLRFAVSEIGSVPRTVPSGATSVNSALAPEVVKKPKIDFSFSRQPVKSVRVAPVPRPSAGVNAGVEYPKDPPSSRACAVRTVATSASAGPDVTWNRMGPVSVVDDYPRSPNASARREVPPGARLNVCRAAK
jgi:hypothetical protein